MSEQSSDNKIYKKLRKHLDSFPIGYPKTESGVELEILKEMFLISEYIQITNTKKQEKSGLLTEKKAHHQDLIMKDM